MIKRPQTAGVTQVALKGSSSKKKSEDEWGDAADDLLDTLEGPKKNNNNDLFN